MTEPLRAGVEPEGVYEITSPDHPFRITVDYHPVANRPGKPWRVCQWIGTVCTPVQRASLREAVAHAHYLDRAAKGEE